MKRFNLIIGFLALVVSLSLVSFSFAQDSTKVKQKKQLRDGSQAGDPVKDQKRQRVQVQDPNSIQHGAGFVDENGDGYNDNAPDHDGDGIPNGQDPDYVPANPDQGKRFGGFVDEDGDGINDRMQDADGDGIPNCQDPDWVKPEDGTGNKFGQRDGKGHGQMGQKGNGFRGAGSGQGTGTGDCDGTGPKGIGSRSR